eukprot:TRINITY_DN9627_c0_g1_i3.p1 TRINITY_DN9627_c0_g1~~TRINITY_DN9627_c0_g1_i3.p1  ORF type:complete len:237 (+),score=37.21 TRINITY_DN9627_c0_g1_i3:36-746(+)
MELNKAEVLRVCKETGFYTTPELNEKLYLQCKGYSEIGGLEEYTGVRALWLEGNCISEIKGIENCRELLTLYLSRNMIPELTGLKNQQKLAKLDVSENLIKKISGLEGCPNLTQLIIAKNYLSKVEDLEGLTSCPKLSTLDISGNKIKDGDNLLTFLEKFTELASLRMMGNGMRVSRREVISKLKNLKSLDDTPVTPLEREAAEAYIRGMSACLLLLYFVRSLSSIFSVFRSSLQP